jgi:hypothetical protein
MSGRVTESKLDRVEEPNLACPVHPNGSEGVADAGAVAMPPMATLLLRHVLRDGELVLLILKPSRWYMLLSCLRFFAIVTILVIAAIMYEDRLPYDQRTYIETGIVLGAGRFMWAVSRWMSKLYVLTDLRIIALSGVFKVEIFDCPLRKVARTRLIRSFKERLFRLGSIEIFPSDDEIPEGLWYMVRRPKRVYEQIVAAVNRAKARGT